IQVFGTISRGSRITVTGADFGEHAPNILIFHPMEHGTAGNELGLDEPVIGSWNRANSFYKMIYEAEPSGRTVARSRRDSDAQFGKLTLLTDEPFINHFLMLNVRARNPDTVPFLDADSARTLV